jgi:putative membrane protein
LALSWPFITAVTILVAFLIAFVWFGNRAIDFALGIVAAVIGGSLLTVVPALLAFGGFFVATINRGFNFTAGISEDGIRLRHGLIETRRQTVPPGRVQAVRLRQSLLWRRKDWWQISINVAGYQDDQAAVSTLLPVGTREDALMALWLVLPDLGDPDPAGTVSRAMSGIGGEGGFTASPRSARWVDPIQWRQRGVRATDRALFVRQGRLVKELHVIPHERTQSMAIRQGPLEKRLGLANVEVHSTKGPVQPVAHHLAVDDAIALFDAQAERAHQGRARQTPEQWMSAVGLT